MARRSSKVQHAEFEAGSVMVAGVLRVAVHMSPSAARIMAAKFDADPALAWFGFLLRELSYEVESDGAKK
jgi:hypothetical protein